MWKKNCLAHNNINMLTYRFVSSFRAMTAHRENSGSFRHGGGESTDGTQPLLLALIYYGRASYIQRQTKKGSEVEKQTRW